MSTAAPERELRTAPTIYEPMLMTVVDLIDETVDTRTLRLEFKDEALRESMLGRLRGSAVTDARGRALQLPEGMNPGSLRSRVRESGIQIAGGLGAYKETCIRIGHMGDIRMADVERTLDVLEGI